MTTALETKLLPQYQVSEALMERFLYAIHTQGGEVSRSENIPGTIKAVDTVEWISDAFAYFSDNKKAIESEFFSELKNEIGEYKSQWFCDVIANDWYNGRGKNGSRIPDLKASVRDFLQKGLPNGVQISELVQKFDPRHSGSPSLSFSDIARLIKVNHYMLAKHLEGWKRTHDQYMFMSDSDIYLRRGISIPKIMKDNAKYIEFDYINSYSLSVSAPEQFSQIRGGVPAIVNGDIHLFDFRILFFSPFVPGMDGGQLEFGIIPSLGTVPIAYQGEHGGVHEYILGHTTGL